MDKNLYVERANGRWEGRVDSEGQSPVVFWSYDLAEVVRYAKREGYTVIRL